MPGSLKTLCDLLNSVNTVCNVLALVAIFLRKPIKNNLAIRPHRDGEKNAKGLEGFHDRVCES